MKAYTPLALALCALPALVQPAFAQSSMEKLIHLSHEKVDICDELMEIVGMLSEKKISADEAATVINRLTAQMTKVENGIKQLDESLSEKELEKLYAKFSESDISSILGETEHGLGNSWEDLKAAKFYKNAALKNACARFFGRNDF